MKAELDAVAQRINEVLQIAAERALGADARPIISLGSNCYAAFLLQGAGIKRASYPFDWIFSTPRMAAHCLNDDFATFLDRSYYEEVPVERRRDGPTVNLCNHRFYHENFHVEFVFNHRNPCDDDDYAYLERCVARFRTVVRERPVVLLHVTYPGRSAELDRGSFDLLSQAVRAYAPLARLVHLTVVENSGLRVPRSRRLSDVDGHTLIEFRAGSAWHALGFGNPFDDMAVLVHAIAAATAPMSA